MLGTLDKIEFWILASIFAQLVGTWLLAVVDSQRSLVHELLLANSNMSDVVYFIKFSISRS